MKLLCFENVKLEVKKAEIYYTIILYIFEILLVVYTVINFKAIIAFQLVQVIMFSTIFITAVIAHLFPILIGIQYNIIELKEQMSIGEVKK
jgi:hypothetical protein